MKLNWPRKMKVWKLCIFLFLILFMAAVISLSFLPQIVASVWHWRHGDQMSFQEWTFPVPHGWDAHAFENGLAIDRVRRPFDRDIASFISIGRLRLNPHQLLDPEKWKRQLVDDESKEGYRFQSEEILIAGTDTAYCYHFDRADDPRKILFTCRLSPSRIFIDFEGSPRHLLEVYQVIRGASVGPSTKAGASRPIEFLRDECGRPPVTKDSRLRTVVIVEVA
jgi:hypothetical protein